MTAIVVYIDGACSGNPGVGGWGALIQRGGEISEIYGHDSSTTNNRMELMAAIKALAYIKNMGINDELITVYTDSQYVANGITTWIHSWKKNDWKRKGAGAVLNCDLWKQLDTERTQLNIDWRWVRGHSGTPGNERADQLARNAIKNIAHNSCHPNQQP